MWYLPYRVSHARYIEIIKARGNLPLPGRHSLAIEDGRIVCYPQAEMLPVRAARGLVAERAAFGLPQLDAMLHGGLTQGSSAMLAGEEGVGKSLLALTWLCEGASRGEPGLLLGFHESRSQIIDKARVFGIDLAPLLERGLLDIWTEVPVALDPNRIAADETLHIPGRQFGAEDAPSGDPITPGPLAPVAPPPPGAPRFPAALLAHPSRLSLAPYFHYWARAYGVPAGLVEAVAWVESGWQQDVVSKTGAIGIGQVEPGTAIFISHDVLHLHASLDPRLPDANIRLSTAYLAWLLWASKGNIANAIGGYYEGLSTLRDKGVYASTRRYVANVGAVWALLRSG